MYNTFFMKNIISFFAVLLFVGCNNVSIDMGAVRFHEGFEFEGTNLTVMEVLSSAKDGWYWTRLYHTTEPDGKGERHDHDPNLGWVGGTSSPIYTFSGDVRMSYEICRGVNPMIYYYKHESFTNEGDSKYVFGEDNEYYWKIIDYDKDKLLIESNALRLYAGGVNYGYATLILKKNIPEDPNWIEKSISYEEYIKQLEEAKNK